MDTFHALVHVRPGARTDAVGGGTPPSREGEQPVLEVRVRARPVDGAATAATEKVLARALGVRPRQVRVVRGATSRDKQIEVDDPPEDIVERWNKLLGERT